MLKTFKTDSEFFSGFSDSDSLLIQKALDIVNQFGNDKTSRPRGIEVAAILIQFNVDLETLLAALLSEPLIRDHLESHAIEEQFGSTIYNLVKDINWLNTLNVYSPDLASQPNQTETLRRMLLSMTQDVRAVLIKLAFRIQRLRTLSREDYEVRRFIAQETLDIYAPIANRLGIGQLKWELEDLAFRYLNTPAYRRIAKSLAENRLQRENSINGFTELLKNILIKENIKVETYGRPKHIYSIWKKMQRKQLGIEELYDLLAVRVIVNKLSSCYEVLGIVHAKWQYIPKEFDDYIANPKENGYQSLHTVVIDPQGNRIEIQIRTREMHEFAELGVAAHWRYKEGGKHDDAAEKTFASLRQLLEEKGDEEILLESFRTELFSDRVYTLTPAGKLIELVKGSTPLDFAYAVHSEIGHRCRGAKVDGHIVPLTYTLKSGEHVEILTAKEGGPNRNWVDLNLGYLKSPRAISKVKAWFRQQKKEQNQAAGKQVLAKEMKRLGISQPNLIELAEHFNFTSAENFFVAIGRGEINSGQLAGATQLSNIEPLPLKTVSKPAKQPSVISLGGINNIQTHFAHCCNPVPGDDIIGFISQSKGVAIHRRDCHSLDQLDAEQQTRLIDAHWGRQESHHAVPILIQAFDRQGLLNDVTQILNHSKINILDAKFQTNQNLSATLELVIQIKNTTQLSHALSKISQLPNILEVTRKQ